MIKVFMKRIFVFCCAIFFSFTTRAQYQIKHFTTENGLPSNGIKGLQWDESTGFLWIATEAGMVRYNGMAFKTFDINTNPDLGSSRIVLAVKNTANKIFVGAEKGNLLTVKENKITTLLMGENTAQYNYNYYSAITASDTLFKQCLKTPWGNSNFTFYNTTILPVNDTACVAFCAGRLYYYSTSTLQPVWLATAPANIKNAFKIGNKLYCINTAGTLFLMDVYQQKYKEESITDTEGKNFVIEQKNSNLFWQGGMENPVILQDQKAWIIEEGKNNAIQCKLIAAGIPANTFFNFAQYKKEGNYLFLASASKGLYVLNQNQLTTKKAAIVDINQINAYYSEVELPDGNIITNDGIIIGDAVPQNNYNIGNGFLKNVYTVNDTLLIYSYKDGIYRYNRKTYNRQLMLTMPVRDNFALAFSETHLYFASHKGIGILQQNGTIDFLKEFDEKTGFRLHLFDMIEPQPGKLLLASCEGLLQFDTHAKTIDTLLKLPSVCIRNLYKERDYIFIGTYGGGFYVLKNGVLKTMPLDNNQYLKYTHCFIKDKNGFCWISTNNGLFKVKMTDILDAYENNLPQIYYHYFGKEDGMESTEMNGGCTPCAIRLKNNNFSFPTMDGLLWLNPENTTITLPSGKIYIDEIQVDDSKIDVQANKTIELPEQVKKLDMLLAVNAWCKKENLYMDYKLNNDEWIKVDMVSGEPKISFANLSYGSYTLSIRKMNGFGIDNYSYSNIAFTIATPFYQQWWFRLLAFLAVAGIAYLIFRIRLRQYDLKEKKLSALVEEKTKDLNLKNIQLEKNDEIKTRLISVINHDIITPLKFMKYAGNALVENKGNISEEEKFETISEITQTAKDMEMLSSQILNWIIYQNPDQRMQQEEFDLHQLVEMVFGVLRFSAKQKNTKLQNDVPINFVVYQYLEPLRVMLYNLVLNSLNFTKDGIITVACRKDAALVILEVSDTGLGMTKEQVNNLMMNERIITAANIDNKKGTGLGYLIIKDLLKLMGGALVVGSRKNEGTTVSVSLPR
jgi:signal transduction histidine kinase